MIIKLENPTRYKVRIKVDGKPTDRTFYKLSDAKDYEHAERRKRRDNGPAVERGPAPSFCDFLKEVYVPHAQLHWGAKTWATRKYQLAMLGEYFGDKRLDRFTLADIEVFKKARKETRKPDGDLIGGAKVNDDVKKLVAILNFARAHHYRAAALGEVEIDQLPEHGTGRCMCWDDEAVQLLYKALARCSPHLLPLTICLVNTGMRPGEGLVTEWSWVDLKRRMLTIQPNEFWSPKDKEPREVPISDAFVAILEQQKGKHPRWVFPTLPDMKNPQGQRYTAWPQNQWDRARRMARRADGTEIGGSPHVCRHTFASHFLRAVPDMFLLSKVLGHASAKTTERNYAHLLPGHLEKARNAVNIGQKMDGFKVVKGGRR